MSVLNVLLLCDVAGERRDDAAGLRASLSAVSVGLRCQRPSESGAPRFRHGLWKAGGSLVGAARQRKTWIDFRDEVAQCA